MQDNEGPEEFSNDPLYKDPSYDEALKKAEEEKAPQIAAMNTALKLITNVARLVAQYHNELLANGVTKEDAVTLSHEMYKYHMEKV